MKEVFYILKISTIFLILFSLLTLCSCKVKYSEQYPYPDSSAPIAKVE